MNPTLKATPTEYRGVVFRSKSEAIMARMFDLRRTLWRYEPWQMFSGNGYVPDFYLAMNHPECKQPNVCTFCIEFKPINPTETYSNGLWQKWRKRWSMVERCGFSLVIADPFDPSSPRAVLNWKPDGWEVRDVPWFFDGLDEAATYRFDLDSGA